MELGHWLKFQKLYIYSLSSPGSEINLTFALRAAVSEIRTDFQNFHIWAWNLAIWPKCQKLHIYCLSIPEGRSRAYFHSTSSGFQDMGRFSKLPYLGMKLGHWAKFQNVAHMSFYPRGSKFSLFSLYGQWFPRYRQIFKISIFGYETWPLVKVPEVWIYIP